MELLDLFCCQGGAGMGFSQCGFNVTGLDIKPQKKYPFKFILGDALEYVIKYGHLYDFIHASPPCQGYSNLTPISHKDNHEKLIPKIRNILNEIRKPYSIENVAGARLELINPIMLCGSMFGLRTQRHRYFETSFEIKAPKKCNHELIPLLVTTASKASIKKRKQLGIRPKSVDNAKEAYGIDWMDFNGLKECIPPEYTKYIGNEYIKSLNKDRYIQPEL